MTEETKQELLKVSGDLTEVALDSVLKDGLFKDIPVFGTIISIANLTRNVSDTLLLKKILSFINNLELKSQEEIEEFNEIYYKDAEHKTIGTKLLFVLDKIDEEIKAKWLAKLFKIYLEKQIDKDHFMRLSSIIGNAYTGDVKEIKIFSQHKSLTSSNQHTKKNALDHLYSIGLLETAGFDGGDAIGQNAGSIFILNESGRIFMSKII